MRGHSKPARGLSLLELLVAIAIIGILLVLLLPAVQFAREAARRVECGSHLRQLGIAFHTHHDALRSLPHSGIDGWWNVPNYVNGAAATGEAQYAGWGFQVLPYLEQSQGLGPDDNARRVSAISTVVPMFYCPTRRPVKPNEVVPSWYPVNPGAAELGADGNYAHGQTDYAGAYCDPSTNPEGGACRYTGPDSPWNVEGDPWRAGAVVRLGRSGIAAANPTIGLGGLRDGTSQVLLLGEKRMNSAAVGRSQLNDNEGAMAGFDRDTMVNATRQPRPDHRDPGFLDGDFRFGSSHPNGFQIVMADGAVRWTAFSVDELVFHRLGCRDDGAVAR